MNKMNSKIRKYLETLSPKKLGLKSKLKVKSISKLGQGTGNAVGMALGLKILAEKFNTSEHKLFTSKVFCLCSDGDMMEGVSHEASALAGHLKLNNLIYI